MSYHDTYNNFRLSAFNSFDTHWLGSIYLPEGKNARNININTLNVNGGATYLVDETTVGFYYAPLGNGGRIWTLNEVMNELRHLAFQLEAML